MTGTEIGWIGAILGCMGGTIGPIVGIYLRFQAYSKDLAADDTLSTEEKFSKLTAYAKLAAVFGVMAAVSLAIAALFFVFVKTPQLLSFSALIFLPMFGVLFAAFRAWAKRSLPAETWGRFMSGDFFSSKTPPISAEKP